MDTIERVLAEKGRREKMEEKMAKKERKEQEKMEKKARKEQEKMEKKAAKAEAASSLDDQGGGRRTEGGFRPPTISLRRVDDAASAAFRADTTRSSGNLRRSVLNKRDVGGGWSFFWHSTQVSFPARRHPRSSTLIAPRSTPAPLAVAAARRWPIVGRSAAWARARLPIVAVRRLSRSWASTCGNARHKRCRAPWDRPGPCATAASSDIRS